jgi:hypothetical protein
VIGHRKIEHHDLHKRAHETLRLPQWQAHHGAGDQGRLDRQVAEPPLPAWRRPARRAPPDNRILRQPDTDVSALNRPAIVLGPAPHTIPPLRDAMTMGFMKLESHAGTRTGRQDALSCHQLDIHASMPRWLDSTVYI